MNVCFIIEYYYPHVGGSGISFDPLNTGEMATVMHKIINDTGLGNELIEKSFSPTRALS